MHARFLQLHALRRAVDDDLHLFARGKAHKIRDARLGFGACLRTTGSKEALHQRLLHRLVFVARKHTRSLGKPALAKALHQAAHTLFRSARCLVDAAFQQVQDRLVRAVIEIALFDSPARESGLDGARQQRSGRHLGVVIVHALAEVVARLQHAHHFRQDVLAQQVMLGEIDVQIT